MPFFSVGEKVPEVISPSSTSGTRLTLMWGRGIARPVRLERRRSRRRGPAAFSATSASRPQNASFFQPTAQPSRASLGVTSREMSWPCSG